MMSLQFIANRSLAKAKVLSGPFIDFDLARRRFYKFLTTFYFVLTILRSKGVRIGFKGRGRIRGAKLNKKLSTDLKPKAGERS